MGVAVFQQSITKQAAGRTWFLGQAVSLPALILRFHVAIYKFQGLSSAFPFSLFLETSLEALVFFLSFFNFIFSLVFMFLFLIKIVVEF